MGQELLSGSYIQADETTVGVQMHDGRGKNQPITLVCLPQLPQIQFA
jgi:hypothetical protein